MGTTKHNFSIQFYQERLADLAVEKKKYTNRSTGWVITRFGWFLLMLLYAYFFFPYTVFSTVGLFAMLVVFFFFVRKSVENKEHLNFIKKVIQINEHEIQASTMDYSSFDAGNRFKNPHHPFSYDMDVFGSGGFFPIINRTVTPKGRELLANHLLNGVKNPAKHTEAMDELTAHLVWSQEYLAYGATLEKESEEVALSTAFEKELSIPSWMRTYQYILPISSVILTLLFSLSIINWMVFLGVLVVLILPVRQQLKTTNELQESLAKVGERIAAMSKQVELFEATSFSSDLLKDFQQRMFTESANGKQGLKDLMKLFDRAEYRNNILIALLFNVFLAWDFRLQIGMKTWRDTYQEEAEKWEEIVYELEVLISGANFRYNFKENTSVPHFVEETEPISMKNIGHPIIPLSKLVTNDFKLSSAEQFVIITGPNMAGKSTFLRSIGVNLMLARAGFHVFAEQFSFPNMALYSSMRTSDDLHDETSYFHAELLRLRFIVDAIERGEEVFIILDEILKGTNSKDKEEGSAKFLKKLNKLNVKGIIATHDLSLTELAHTHPTIINKYFDTTIEGENISFDYQIRNGVAQNMNASFLLRKMKLIDE